MERSDVVPSPLLETHLDECPSCRRLVQILLADFPTPEVSDRIVWKIQENIRLDLRTSVPDPRRCRCGPATALGVAVALLATLAVLPRPAVARSPLLHSAGYLAGMTLTCGLVWTSVIRGWRESLPLVSRILPTVLALLVPVIIYFVQFSGAEFLGSWVSDLSCAGMIGLLCGLGMLPMAHAWSVPARHPSSVPLLAAGCAGSLLPYFLADLLCPSESLTHRLLWHWMPWVIALLAISMGPGLYRRLARD